MILCSRLICCLLVASRSNRSPSDSLTRRSRDWQGCRLHRAGLHQGSLVSSATASMRPTSAQVQAKGSTRIHKSRVCRMPSPTNENNREHAVGNKIWPSWREHSDIEKTATSFCHCVERFHHQRCHCLLHLTGTQKCQKLDILIPVDVLSNKVTCNCDQNCHYKFIFANTQFHFNSASCVCGSVTMLYTHYTCGVASALQSPLT